MSRVSTYITSSDVKFLGTLETLSVLLEHRKIMSECIREMDASGLNYISEQAIFGRVQHYTKNIKSDTRKRIKIALSTANLLQSHIVMELDNQQGENRLYFQASVLGVVRLCDVSLFKKLTDVQLKTHLQVLNQAHKQMVSGQYNFADNDDDFTEFVDHLFMNMGRLMSDIRQNVVKMQSISKDLEALTSQSVRQSLDTAAYVAAKETWLNEIVKLYERHILPILLFLNPDTSYQDLDGLNAVLSKISATFSAHHQHDIAQNLQSYALSFLNFYQPIEATADAVNRFIHKERDSIKRFNAIEYFYQKKLLPELNATQSDNLNKKLMGNAAVVLPRFSQNIKAFGRPIGYSFSDSPAYYKNLFNELEARIADAFEIDDLSSVFGKASANPDAANRMQRHFALHKILARIHLRETSDVLKMLHLRLKDEFAAYELYDLIACVGHYASQQLINGHQFSLKVTNRFAVAEHKQRQFKYRKIRCVKFVEDNQSSIHNSTDEQSARPAPPPSAMRK